MPIANILNPRIEEVHCSRIRFEPGDRVLVKVRAHLTPEQRKRIHSSVQRWTGDAVEILVIDTTQMELTVEKRLQIRPEG